ncbi:MAG: metallophosphoesterase [Aristaeellaceae bacterium]
MIRPVTAERPLKILGFTDMHLDGNGACARWTLRLMRETVEAEAPDLVIFAGDNVTGGDNRGRAEQLAAAMTSLGVPWCPILGNHEGDNPFSIARREMARIFRTSPCCLLPEQRAVLADGGRVDGETNYAVTLTGEDGQAVFRLIFLDSGSDMAPEDVRRFGLGGEKCHLYDYVKESQIAWYREQAAGCPSAVFCHIPLPEFAAGYAEGERLAGANRERVCCPMHNSGLFDALRECGTVLCVAGHDHINDSRVRYRGVTLMYNRMSGLSSYNVISKGLGDRLIQGCSVYTVSAGGEISIGDILYEERYPQYREAIHGVIRK